jgi:hypothetical protein
VAGAVFDISAEILATRASDTLVNLGPMRQGEVVLYNARLHNAGTEPMVITDIATSCGCTSVEYDKKPIPVGGEGAFSLRFDSRGMWGTQMKLVEIRTSASPHSFRLMLQADVTEE